MNLVKGKGVCLCFLYEYQGITHIPVGQEASNLEQKYRI